MFGWLLTVRSKRFIIRRLVFIKDTYLYFLTMWVVHKGLYTNNQEHSEMKYPMFEVWTIGTTNPSKSLPQTLYPISDSLCCPIVSVWNVLAPTGNRKKYHHELWCTYSKILIGVLKQWSCPNEFISSWRQSKWVKSKKWLYM